MKEEKKETSKISMPKRGLTLELLVGIFSLIGVIAVGYLSVGLGGLELGDGGQYQIKADFDNVSGLQEGASVEIAGVPIGSVSRIELNDPGARVVLSVDKEISIKDDDIASIRTKGIIGDRFVKISRGSSEDIIPPDEVIFETESVVDFEDIIGKIVHSLTEGDEEE